MSPQTLESLPELTGVVRNGFNMKRGDTLGSPIFQLSFEDGNQLAWGSSCSSDSTTAAHLRSYPDQVVASAGTRLYQVQQSQFIENQAEYDSRFSLSAAADVSGVSFNASLNSSLLYHGNLFQRQASTYALNIYCQEILSFRRRLKPADLRKARVTALTQEFEDALAQLPTTFQGNETQYFQFLDRFGTHYVASGSLGGMVVLETAISESALRQTSLESVQLSISAGYDSMISSGKFRTDIAIQSSQFLQKNRESVEIQLTALGGVFNEEITTWSDSLYGGSSILLLKMPGGTPIITLQSIALLADGSDRQAQLEAATRRYLLLPEPLDGLLGTGIAVTTNRVFPAGLIEGGGFVVGQLAAPPGTVPPIDVANQSWGTISVFTAPDVEGDPTELRSSASQSVRDLISNDEDLKVPYSSLMVPISDNDSWRLSSLTAANSANFNPDYHHPPRISFRFVPILTGLGRYEDFEAESSLRKTPREDGFVVVYLEDSETGTVTGSISQPNGEQVELLGASNSNKTRNHPYFVKSNGFCMPVLAHREFEINGTSAWRGSFVPFNGLAFPEKTWRDRLFDTVYQARTDGFLTVHLHAKDRYGAGFAKVYVSQDPDALLTDPLPAGLVAASTSVDFEDNGTQVRHNSLTLPINTGSYYRVEYFETFRGVVKTARWFELGLSAEEPTLQLGDDGPTIVMADRRGGRDPVSREPGQSADEG